MWGKKRVIVVCSIICLMLVGIIVSVKHFAKADEMDSIVVNIDDDKSDTTTQKLAADDIKHGAILQTWCWSFNTIKEKLPEIKAAGYTAIQTSPIQECRIGENNKDYSLDLRNWYYTYQPVDFKIGNYL